MTKQMTKEQLIAYYVGRISQSPKSYFDNDDFTDEDIYKYAEELAAKEIRESPVETVRDIMTIKEGIVGIKEMKDGREVTKYRIETPELKPCPDCDNEVYIMITSDNVWYLPKIVCNRCGKVFTYPVTDIKEAAIKDTIKAWNERCESLTKTS